MNVSNLYVPNAEKWIEYYKNVARGNINSYDTAQRRKQRGGNISSDFSNFMIPIDQFNHNTKKVTDLDVNMVSPVQQVVDQAKSEVMRIKKKQYSPKNHLKRNHKTVQTTYKRRAKRGGNRKKAGSVWKKARKNTKSEKSRTSFPEWLH